MQTPYDIGLVIRAAEFTRLASPAHLRQSDVCLGRESDVIGDTGLAPRSPSSAHSFGKYRR